jgi:hypothetical protein
MRPWFFLFFLRFRLYNCTKPDRSQDIVTHSFIQ